MRRVVEAARTLYVMPIPLHGMVGMAIPCRVCDHPSKLWATGWLYGMVRKMSQTKKNRSRSNHPMAIPGWYIWLHGMVYGMVARDGCTGWFARCHFGGVCYGMVWDGTFATGWFSIYHPRMFGVTGWPSMTKWARHALRAIEFSRLTGENPDL